MRAATAPRSRSLPAANTFTMVEFDFKTLEHRLRELAFLNSGVRICPARSRHPEPVDVELHYEGGLDAFVRYLDKRQDAAHWSRRSC